MARAFTSLAEIEALFARRGGDHYGEGVSQIEHALQCAGLAEAAGASPAIVAAALLHDVGHLLEAEDAANEGDRRHERSGAALLARLFGAEICAPIALHVAAKRYLCAIEPAYQAGLSAASQASLALQGGPFDENGVRAFQRRRNWRAAVAVRRFDDGGKSTEPSRRTFADYLPLLEQAGRAPSTPLT